MCSLKKYIILFSTVQYWIAGLLPLYLKLRIGSIHSQIQYRQCSWDILLQHTLGIETREIETARKLRQVFTLSRWNLIVLLAKGWKHTDRNIIMYVPK